MEIKYIREFVSLAETNSYFETSEHLFVTTSSLSRHIKALEDEIGVPLFDRTTRKVKLNHYGRLFLPYAQELIRIDAECTRAFEAAHSDVRDSITIGSIPMMTPYKITNLLAEFQHANKSTLINVKEEDSLHLVQLLRNDECDFAFLRDGDDAEDEFVKIPFTQDNLVVVVPGTHPLADQKAVRIDQLKDESLLLIGKDAFMYRLCTDLCKKAGFQPKVVFTSYRASNLVDLVNRGLGVAMLMKKPAATLISPDMRLIDLSPLITSTIYLAYRNNHPMSNAAQRFLDMVRSLSR
ncbi:MAG: LysR family transcriptional regulator [Clostridia bacterium]|nr:LysR family transcriptional regulator [Clostridia bacterium]